MAKSKKEELEVVEQEKSTPTQAKDVELTPPPVKKESNKLKLVYDDYENSANTLTTLANELNNQYTPDIVEKKIGE